MSSSVYTPLRKWMNDLIDLYKKSESLTCYSDKVSASHVFDAYGIRIEKGIESMAVAVGHTLEIEMSECGLYIEKSFEYKRIRFYQLDVVKGDSDDE